MMKQVKIKLPMRVLTLAGGLLLTASAFAQNGALKGHVLDASGEPVMGATITANGKALALLTLMETSQPTWLRERKSPSLT